MNNIQLNIVANAQFQQVYAEVAKLKEAMLSLQKASVGGPFTAANTASIKQAQSAFDSAVLSTRAFTVEHVAMASSVEKFGKQLKSGQLSLSNYYKIWRDNAKGVSSELDTLATSQARLNRSIAIADPLRPGYAKLVTDINGVVTAQEKQIFYQKALNTALQQGSMKLIDFGKNTQWMGRQLTVGLSMPLAMFGAGISQSFLTVDKELTRMQKVYGTGLIQPTQQALKQIRSDVQTLGTELARTLGTSMQETASMAADLAATGLEGQKLIGATKEAIRMATLGELDHQQAMQATVSLQNVYKLSTNQLSDAVNFLNAVENQTSTSLQDLVDAIPRVGPIVQQLGGSFKDTAAMMVAMKEAGVPAAQGANAIKSALSSLINPTKAAVSAFSAYNINIAGIAKATGGAPIAMLRSLADSMKGLDRLAQAQLIEKMFGKYQYARIQALIDNINKVGSQTQTVFQLMGASTQDLATMAANELKQQTESASGRFKRMTETLKADFLPIGQAFVKSFTAIGNAIDKVINGARALAKAMGPAAGILGKLLGGGIAGLIVVGPIIMLVGLFANLIGNILRGANAMRMFKQGMDAAGPSENKFLAGLHGMRNFYEDLDKSTIAARNQMDLMPEAITSNAKAFDILSRAIQELTMQFDALAVAQREAMGMGAAATGKSPFNIPFKAPGFSTGYINLPGSGNQDTLPAMLAPGESIMTAAATAKYSPILRAMNKDNLPGFMSGIVNYRGQNLQVETKAENFKRIKSIFEDSSVEAGLKDELARTLQNMNGKFSIDQLRKEMAGTKGWSETSIGKVNSDKRYSYQGSKTFEQHLQGAGRSLEARAANAERYGIANWVDQTGRGSANMYDAVRAHYLGGTPKESNGTYLSSSWNPALFTGMAQAPNQLTESLKNKTNSGVYKQAIDNLKQIDSTLTGLDEIFVKITKGEALSHDELVKQGKIAEEASKILDKDVALAKSVTPKYKNYLDATAAGARSRKSFEDEMIREGKASAEDFRNMGVKNIQEVQNAIAAIAEEAQAKGVYTPELHTKLVNMGRQLGTQAGAAVEEGLRAYTQTRSPSVVMQKAGRDLGAGGVNGLKSTLPEYTAVGAMLGSAGASGEAGAGGVKGLWSNIRQNGLKNTMSEFKTGGKFTGVGMGLGMAGMMAGSILGTSIKGTAGNAISNVSTYAGMGMMFGPEGAAVGAAIGGLKTVFDYMKKNAAETAAKWHTVTSMSSTDLYAFKSTALSTSLQTKNLSIEANKVAKGAMNASKGMSTLTEEFGAAAPGIQSLAEQLKKLPKGDPLGDLVKTISDPKYKLSSVAGNIRKQVNTAISTGGLDPAQAKTYVASVLQAAGRTSDFATVWKEVSRDVAWDNKKGTGNAGAATVANLTTLAKDKKFEQTDYREQKRDSSGYLMATAKSYKDLAGPAKALADQMKNLYAITSNGSLKFADLKGRMDAVKKSGIDTGTGLVALEQAIRGTGSADDIKRLNQAEGYIKELGPNAKLSASEIMKMNAVLQVMTPDQLRKWADANGKKLGLTAASKMASIIDAYANSGDFKKAIDAVNKATAAAIAGSNAGGTTDYSKQFNPLLKKYQGILKLVETQTSAQKKYNDQLKATQDYHQKQMDYYNQMKMAFTSGNYLGAMMAQTGAKANQADFKAQTQDAKNQDIVQNLQDLVSRIQEGQSSGKSLNQFLKDNKIFNTSVDNVNWQKQLFGGVDKNTYTSNTGKIIAKANAAASSGQSAANAGTFQTLVVNVSADNSVVPETFASTVATKVLAAQKTAQSKTSSSNKVGNPNAKGARGN